MPVFAPVYKPTTQQQTYWSRQQTLQSKKRKRDDGTSDEAAQNPDDALSDSSAIQRDPHPVNQKDPYHIAGLSREDDDLPPPPFPHAAVKTSRKPAQDLDSELAALKPPLYQLPSGPATSSKRRHLDNLTTILHRSLLRSDWPRAARAWSILIRTETGSRGIDIRRHGRWGIGAELLMRRGAAEGAQFSDEGFALARQYYERLILQYPHTAQSQYYARERESINATAVYPALFNIWVFEVQDRAKRARKALEARLGSESGQDLDDEAQLRTIRALELEQALPIAQRMDELLLSPPYDKNDTLLELRGMVALWIADLHADMAKMPSEEVHDNIDFETYPTADAIELHKAQSFSERAKARETFDKLIMSDAKLHPRVSRIVQDFTV